MEGETLEALVVVEGEGSESIDDNTKNADVDVDSALFDEAASADRDPTSPEAPSI